MLFAKRNRRANVLPFILGLYSSNIDSIVGAISSSLRELDARVEIVILDRKKIILIAFTLVYISDTP